ncbi:UDP-N-acetylglucosamine 1-carboxyvinyltransferase [Cyclonatronum proteinivorum]|uniref:UDP-N-acetylglucosamine 1-carboxyvinyltransferase n=1 Tax=Cyclonatronum proteinivorum TaxID=1457365 RepID=A0A345UM08_9BACT|nr:UDP-N-acetylglucosamine 1-carboxyvinyltransferase [Cyclonatronum proteinivorum]AXJ01510.1 UDP-N-acetylglucosamine 1-carboxyvinyltransferase [Cyclonatronum proteinivorum]
MDKFVIEGGVPLKGEIRISGSKNAALPLMAAALLADGKTTLRNIPALHDILTFNNVMRVTGARVEFEAASETLTIDPENIYYPEAPYELVRKMRASFYMLGALLGRGGYARVSLPGGCAWGPRPVDLHLEGMKAFGANIRLEEGYVVAELPEKANGLSGGQYKLSPSSVGATVNLLLATVKGTATAVIENAAKEPDVVQLCHFLTQMGANIDGIGTSTLRIQGVSSLKGVTFDNAPDRIETGTFMILAAMHPESQLTLTNTAPDDLGFFTDWFRKTGAEITIEGSSIHLKAPQTIQPVSVITEIYPGFPTDLQAQWATLMTQAEGESHVTDTIYPDRFSYVPELARLGANIKVRNNTAVIKGKTPLSGTSIMSTDLRASVSLVMAAMCASGRSEVLRVYHLDRGYARLEEKLNQAGARITRVNGDVEEA